MLHNSSDRLPGAVARGPGPLEVKAAQVASDIDYLTDEVQAGHAAALHGFGGEFIGVDAACGYFGFLVAFSTGRNHAPGVQLLFELGKGGIGPSARTVELQPTISQA